MYTDCAHWPNFTSIQSVAPERIWKRGNQSKQKWGTDPAQSAGKIFLVVPLHILSLKAQLVVLVSAFVMVSTVWSVSCLLFFYSGCPCAQPCVKVGGGGTCPPRAPWSRLNCIQKSKQTILLTSYSVVISFTCPTSVGYRARQARLQLEPSPHIYGIAIPFLQSTRPVAPSCRYTVPSAL